MDKIISPYRPHTDKIISPYRPHTQSARSISHISNPLTRWVTHAIFSLYRPHTHNPLNLPATHTILSICRPHTQSSQSIALYRPHPQSSHSVGHTRTKSSQSARSISHISNPLTRWVTHEILSFYRPHTQSSHSIGHTHSIPSICERSESVRERRVALYKNDQQQQHRQSVQGLMQSGYFAGLMRWLLAQKCKPDNARRIIAEADRLGPIIGKQIKKKKKKSLITLLGL